MSTRSLTIFKNEEGKEICIMYRHSDGYPSGHGQALADFLYGSKVVNGLGSGGQGVVFNGAECLTAAVIAHFKDGPGRIYIYPPGSKDMWEEYIYTIEVKQGEEPKIILESVYDKKVLFNGTASQFNGKHIEMG